MNQTDKFTKHRILDTAGYDVFSINSPIDTKKDEFPADFNYGDPVFALKHIGYFDMEPGHVLVIDPAGIKYYMPAGAFNTLFPVAAFVKEPKMPDFPKSFCDAYDLAGYLYDRFLSGMKSIHSELLCLLVHPGFNFGEVCEDAIFQVFGERRGLYSISWPRDKDHSDYELSYLTRVYGPGDARLYRSLPQLKSDHDLVPGYAHTIEEITNAAVSLNLTPYIRNGAYCIVDHMLRQRGVTGPV